MGCGETLFLAAGGFVTCSYDKCPAPHAASVRLERVEPQESASAAEPGEQ